ncbi:MAG: tRNA (N(6)-L-threonylcarbamoyladenosine(37)-C(2))-methylthiotransferase [Candidatus Anstonellales archaeon]
MKVYIETYGCTLNKADSDMIRAILRKRGHKIVEREKDAEAIVLNTCTVKSATQSKILSRLKELKGKRVIVAGCMVVNQNKIRAIMPLANLVKPSGIARIAEAVERADEAKVYGEMEKGLESKEVTAPILRIPASEGCLSFCHFCQTKLARPKFFSYAPQSIIRHLREGIKKGAREVQLTSMDLGAYGADRKTNIVELVKRINEEKGDFMVRLGMMNPQHAARHVDSLLKNMGKCYRFFHVPVQSGSNRVLKLMNRGHTTKEFAEVVRKAREFDSMFTIATDIIVGYPGEKESDFRKTLELIRKNKVDVVNVSKFSPMEGTVAKLMKQIRTEVVKKRSVVVSLERKKVAEERNKEMVGRRERVVVLEEGKGGSKGRDIYYRQVVLDRRIKIGSFVEAEIEGASTTSLFGRVV